MVKERPWGVVRNNMGFIETSTIFPAVKEFSVSIRIDSLPLSVGGPDFTRCSLVCVSEGVCVF